MKAPQNSWKTNELLRPFALTCSFYIADTLVVGRKSATCHYYYAYSLEPTRTYMYYVGPNQLYVRVVRKYAPDIEHSRTPYHRNVLNGLKFRLSQLAHTTIGVISDLLRIQFNTLNPFLNSLSVFRMKSLKIRLMILISKK